MKSNNPLCLRRVLAAMGIASLCLAPAWSQSQKRTSAEHAAAEYARLGADNPVPVASANGAMAVNEHYLIGNEDVLAINVWKEPDVSRMVPVRSDGKISLPLIGEVQATGKTPKELEIEIAKGLRDYISEPEVTVIVQETKSRRFSILGQVQRPGSYSLNGDMRVLDAIAIAGGFRDFAKVKSIRILRQESEGKQISLPFNYKDVVKGSNPGQNVELQPKDTIYVP